MAALGIKLDKVACNVLDALLGLLLDALPCSGAKCGKLRRLAAVSAAIFADFV